MHASSHPVEEQVSPGVINRLRLLFLLPWKEEGRWGLYQEIHPLAKELRIVHPYGGWANTRLLGRVAGKLGEFLVPLTAARKRHRFDVVMSWSMRIGIVHGFVSRLLRDRTALHVMRDFHINLERRDTGYRLRLFLLKLAIPGIDLFLCTSRQEELIYARLFNIDRKRLLFFPDFPIASLCNRTPCAGQDYIFAYGNSDRDFDTLVRAAARFQNRMVILSQTYVPGVSVPGHVTLIRERLSLEELVGLVSACRLMVLPLQSYWVAAGQNSMLETMALGRPLIVTSNLATLEYAEHRKTAVFVEARDAAGLAEELAYFWHHSDEAEAIGRQARNHAQQLIDDRLPTFLRVLDRLMVLQSVSRNH